MLKKILIILVIMILFGAGYPSIAYIRDANIANSSDSIGLGWLIGFYLTGEKRIGEYSSIGAYYLPPVSLHGNSRPVSMLQIGYNNQFLGNKGDAVALSFCLGTIGLNTADASWAIFPDSWSKYNGHISEWTIMPDIGLALSWKIIEPLVFRFQTVLYMPYFAEFGCKFDERTELGVGLGMPFQFISMRHFF